MTPPYADQLSPRTFCKVVPLVPACSHGVIAENMSGGTCVTTADAVTSAQALLHVSPASRDHSPRLPGLICCLAICVPGELPHVGLLPWSCLTVLLPAPRSFSQSPCGVSV